MYEVTIKKMYNSMHIFIGIAALITIVLSSCAPSISSEATRGMSRYLTQEKSENLTLSCEQREPRPRSWAVVIGVNHYLDPRIPDLKGAVLDAWNMYHLLVNPLGGQVPRSQVKLLLDESATIDNMREALGQFLRSACPQDQVTIYFAGHGSPEPENPDEAFLLLHNTRLDKLVSTGFAMSQLPKFLEWRNDQLSRLLLLIDACHSGNIKFEQIRGVKFGLSNTTERTVNRHQSFRKQISKLSSQQKGWAVISATAEDQLAIEGGEREACKVGGELYRGGLFTCALLKGLVGGADLNYDQQVSYNEIFDFVSLTLEDLRGVSQTPQRSGDLNGEATLFKSSKQVLSLPQLPQRLAVGFKKKTIKPWAYSAAGLASISLGLASYFQEDSNQVNSALKYFLSDPQRSVHTQKAFTALQDERDNQRSNAISAYILSGALFGLSAGFLIWDHLDRPPRDEEVYAKKPRLIIKPQDSNQMIRRDPQ